MSGRYDEPFRASGVTLTLDDLASRLERSRVGGRFARGRCPWCGSRSGWGTIVDGAPRVGCFACQDWPAIRAMLGLEGLAATWVAPARVGSDCTDRPLDMVVEADDLDRVLRVLLRRLAMPSDRRRAVLGRDRGIPPQIRDRMSQLLGPIPSHPATWRSLHRQIVDDLRAVAPLEVLRRVPELAAREGGSFAVLHTVRSAKYFEPWTDEQGRIVALRAYMGRRTTGSKYLVSKGRTGPMVHFAFGVPREQASSAPWLITEGWMKAEVAAHHLGCVAVGLPGIGAHRSWRRAVEVLQRLAPDAPTFVAFDAQIWTNRPDLTVHALDLAARIERATGRPAGFAIWKTAAEPDGEPDAKGIDDAIVAGREVSLVDRRGLAAVLEPALDLWERADAA